MKKAVAIHTHPVVDSEKKAFASLAIIEQIDTLFPFVDVVAFCDGARGSNDPNATQGGAAAVLLTQDGQFSVHGGYYKVSNSTEAELAAIILALEGTKPGQSVAILSDCQPLMGICNKLVSSPGFVPKRLSSSMVARLRSLLKSRTVLFQWVPGHAGILENEICDKVAKLCLARRQKCAYSTLAISRDDASTLAGWRDQALEFWNRIVDFLGAGRMVSADFFQA